MSSYFQGDGDGQKLTLVPGTFDTQNNLLLWQSYRRDDRADQRARKRQRYCDTTRLAYRVARRLQTAHVQSWWSRAYAIFEDLLLALAPLFEQVTNPLIISGHTDAIPFKKRFGRQSGWALSASRADVARKRWLKVECLMIASCKLLACQIERC